MTCFVFCGLLCIVPFIVGLFVGWVLIVHDAELPVAMIIGMVTAFASTILLYWIFHETAGFELITNTCRCGELLLI